MAIQIFDEKAAALRGEDATEAFLKSESEAIERESAEIQLESAALMPECQEFDDLVSNVKSYCAIGFANLDESQRAEMLKATERAQALKETLGLKYAAFEAKCAAHHKRQDAFTAALRKRIEFDRAKEAKVMQDFAGLLAYGMASGQLSKDWQFAKSVVDDYQKAKDPEDRAAHFNTFSLVPEGHRIQAAGRPHGAQCRDDQPESCRPRAARHLRAVQLVHGSRGTKPTLQ